MATKKEDLSKLVEILKKKEVSKKQEKPIEKKVEKPVEKKKVEEEDGDDLEIGEDFFDSDNRFVRQVRHSALSSGLKQTPNLVNLEKSVEDIEVSPTLKQEELYSAAKYGSNSEDSKYASSGPGPTSMILERAPIGINRNQPNEFVREANFATPSAATPQEAYAPKKFDQNKAMFGQNTENEFIRKYKQ